MHVYRRYRVEGIVLIEREHVARAAMQSGTAGEHILTLLDMAGNKFNCAGPGRGRPTFTEFAPRK